jgi:hypothetical protein
MSIEFSDSLTFAAAIDSLHESLAEADKTLDSDGMEIVEELTVPVFEQLTLPAVVGDFTVPVVESLMAGDIVGESETTIQVVTEDPKEILDVEDLELVEVPALEKESLAPKETPLIKEQEQAVNISAKKTLHRFKCNDCSYTSQTKNWLVEHVNAVHLNMKNFKCHKCDYATGFSSNMSAHKLKPHEQCDQCDVVMTSKYLMVRHKMQVHALRTKTYQCESCPFKARNLNLFQMHVKTAHSSFGCSFCTFKTRFKHSVANHVKVHHKDQVADHKDKVAYHKDQVADTAIEGSLVKCDHCNFKTLYQKVLDAHSRDAHKSATTKKVETGAPKAALVDVSNILRCKQCNYKTLHKSALANHATASHGAFKCNYCDFSSGSRNLVQIHLKSFHPEKAAAVAAKAAAASPAKATAKDTVGVHIRYTATSEGDKNAANKDVLACKFSKSCQFKTRDKRSLVIHTRNEHMCKSSKKVSQPVKVHQRSAPPAKAMATETATTKATETATTKAMETATTMAMETATQQDGTAMQQGGDKEEVIEVDDRYHTGGLIRKKLGNITLLLCR